MARGVGLVIFALFLGLLILLSRGGEPPGLRPPPLPELSAGSSRAASRTPAPDFRLPDPGGGQHTLSDYRGKVVLLNFWATWCAPCLEELPMLEALHRQLSDDGLVVLALSVDGSLDPVERFLSSRAYELTVLHDPEERASRSYAVRGFPETVVIDVEGRIVTQAVGAWDWGHPDVVTWLRTLLVE